jgi:hypothetical protein
MTARKPEPLCPYRHFIDEDTRNPRGRVRSTLKILEDRERGENEVQMCSNGRMEEMCYAVIEASDLLDAARASLAAAERERDEARLKANILADGAFHDGKERSRLTDWTTELRGQVSALTVERDALLAEVEAWRRFDDDGCTGTFGITARRLQAMNEGGERG